MGTAPATDAREHLVESLTRVVLRHRLLVVLDEVLPWDAWPAIAAIVGANVVSQLLARRRQAARVVPEPIRASDTPPKAVRSR